MFRTETVKDVYKYNTSSNYFYDYHLLLDLLFERPDLNLRLATLPKILVHNYNHIEDSF